MRWKNRWMYFLNCLHNVYVSTWQVDSLTCINSGFYYVILTIVSDIMFFQWRKIVVKRWTFEQYDTTTNKKALLFRAFKIVRNLSIFVSFYKNKLWNNFGDFVTFGATLSENSLPTLLTPPPPQNNANTFPNWNSPTKSAYIEQVTTAGRCFHNPAPRLYLQS